MECLAVQKRVRTWGGRPFKPFAVPLPVGHRCRRLGEFVAGRPTQVLLPPMQTPLYSTCCPKSFLRQISPFLTSREEWIFVAPQFKNTCAKKNAYLNLNGRSQPSSEPPIALPVRMHRPWSVHPPNPHDLRWLLPVLKSPMSDDPWAILHSRMNGSDLQRRGATKCFIVTFMSSHSHGPGPRMDGRFADVAARSE